MKSIVALLLTLLMVNATSANMTGGDFYIVSDYAAERPWPTSSGYEEARSVEQYSAPHPLQYQAIVLPGLVVDLLACSPQGGMLVHLGPMTGSIVLLCAPTPQRIASIGNIASPQIEEQQETPSAVSFDDKSIVLTEDVELMGLATSDKSPIENGSTEAHGVIQSTSDEMKTEWAIALFQKDIPLPANASPLAEFAKLLAIPPAIGVPNIAIDRGNSKSVSLALKALSQHVKSHENEVTPVERPLIHERITQICTFLDDSAKVSPPVDERRVTAICVALSQIGQVEAHRGIVEDGDNRPHRYGWRRLREYFRVAFDGKMWSALENQIKYSKEKYPPHWCGIFCWWALKVAGYDLPPWPTGVGIYGSVPQRPRKSDSRPGDIAFHGGKNGHMALVVAINGDQMQTIDGNTLNPTKGTGGQVWFKPNKRLSAMHSMYSPARDSTFP